MMLKSYLQFNTRKLNYFSKADKTYIKYESLFSRRKFLLEFLKALLLVYGSSNAYAMVRNPPDDFNVYQSELYGYSFFYPNDWEKATTSGNEIFYRNPKNPVESLFIEVSSPSSIKLTGVSDLGSPYEAAQNYLNLYLREYMSTRLGVRRDSEIISAKCRLGPGGKKYYDIDFTIRSFASRQQMSTTQSMGFQELEWDRTLFTTLGISNNRLYELRVQAETGNRDTSKAKIQLIRESFECLEIM
jgi:hypothetical protein